MNLAKGNELLPKPSKLSLAHRDTMVRAKKCSTGTQRAETAISESTWGCRRKGQSELNNENAQGRDRDRGIRKGLRRQEESQKEHRVICLARIAEFAIGNTAKGCESDTSRRSKRLRDKTNSPEISLTKAEGSAEGNKSCSQMLRFHSSACLFF